MKLLNSLIASVITVSAIAQSTPPPVYINFVSHNEPDDDLHTNLNYTLAKTNVLQLAQLLDPYNAKWNLQTCDEFVLGALSVDSYSNNVFRTLQTNYPNLIEIDPRSKVDIMGNNIADTYHLLDSAGAQPTRTLGGFIYYSAGSPPIDWDDYLVTKWSQSADYPSASWDCNLIWGAGSPNHAYDFYNWGIWKPQASSTNALTNETLFYTHEPNNSLWYIGSGCPPAGTNGSVNPGSFDPTDNVSDVTGPLKTFIDSIQNHLLPWDRVYNYSITINQSAFGTTLFNKLTDICDSVQLWGTSLIQWASLTEKKAIFDSWSSTFNHPYSQWSCGETWPLAGMEDNNSIEAQIFPNPSNGVFQVDLPEAFNGTLSVLNIYGQVISTVNPNSGSFIVDLSNESSGIYLIRFDEGDRSTTYRVIKQ